MRLFGEELGNNELRPLICLKNLNIQDSVGASLPYPRGNLSFKEKDRSE